MRPPTGWSCHFSFCTGYGWVYTSCLFHHFFPCLLSPSLHPLSSPSSISHEQEMYIPRSPSFPAHLDSTSPFSHTCMFRTNHHLSLFVMMVVATLLPSSLPSWLPIEYPNLSPRVVSSSSPISLIPLLLIMLSLSAFDFCDSPLCL